MKKLVIVIGIFIVIFPIVLITYVSSQEMQKYEPKVNYAIAERSYGDPVLIQRTTIEETVPIHGKFISNSFTFVDIKNNSLDDVKTVVSVNDEVKKGELLAYINSKPIYSNVNGIVSEIDAIRLNGYIKILNVDNLLLESYMDPTAKLLVGKTYKVDENIRVKLVSLSNIIDESGRKVYFQVEGGNFIFGQTVDFEVSTGVVYKDVLAIDKNCVYQKEKNGPYYVRRVDQSGRVIGEVQVKVGIANNNIISITGANEGWYCDSGYSKLMNVNLEDKK